MHGSQPTLLTVYMILQVISQNAVGSQWTTYLWTSALPTTTGPTTSTISPSTIPTTTTLATTTSPFPCPFNYGCYCGGYSKGFFVSCQNVANFPTFTTANLNGFHVQLDIQGNISYIPANCISSLTGLSEVSFTVVGESGEDFSLKPLFVDPEAFNGVIQTIQSITFQQFSFATMPTKALTNMSSLVSLTFDICDIPYIADYSFTGVSCVRFVFDNTNLQMLEQHAFDGLVVSQELAITNSLLRNISTAFQKVKVPVLNLSNNKIVEILDYAFAPCANASCANVIETLYLNNNPIQFIANNAFTNLPQLQFLYLQNCKLATVPTYSLVPIPNLTQLTLYGNEISFIATNSFYKQHILTSLDLSSNPVTEIETGAFNGLTSFSTYNLANFPELTNIDLLITYGMSSLRLISFTNCPSLSDLYLTDYTKIPLSLQTIAANSGMNLSAISSDLQYWLDTSSIRVVDISNNPNFNCNPTIQWMSKFVLCSSKQLAVANTFCAGTKQSITTYLQSFRIACD